MNFVCPVFVANTVKVIPDRANDDANRCKPLLAVDNEMGSFIFFRQNNSP
jgi:hypothetical protein